MNLRSFYCKHVPSEPTREQAPYNGGERTQYCVVRQLGGSMRKLMIAVGVVTYLAAGAPLAAQVETASEPSPCANAISTARGTVSRLGGGAVGQGVRVTLAWNALQLSGLAVRALRCERSAETRDDGTFEISGVPQDETFLLMAVGPSGEAGVSLRHAAADVGGASLMVFLPTVGEVSEAAQHSGSCQTAGRVVSPTGTPVPNARVRVDGREAVLTDWRGAFLSRTCGPSGAEFDVRGLTVAAGEWWMPLTAPAAVVAISLDRPRPRLDAVVVRAPQQEFRDVTGFNRRCRGGTGACMTLADLQQSQPASMRDFISASKGALLAWNGRITLGRFAGCPATVLVNGTSDPGWDLNALNMDQVVGVELHGRAPLEFGGLVAVNPVFWRGNSNDWAGDILEMPVNLRGRFAGGTCGAVVVWTSWGLGQEISN